jgi:hypothetical protein
MRRLDKRAGAIYVNVIYVDLKRGMTFHPDPRGRVALS